MQLVIASTGNRKPKIICHVRFMFNAKIFGMYLYNMLYLEKILFPNIIACCKFSTYHNQSIQS